VVEGEGKPALINEVKRLHFNIRTGQAAVPRADGSVGRVAAGEA
jgi:hypothetical protein